MMTETTTTTEPTLAPMTLSVEDCAAIRTATSYVVRLEGETASLELTRRTMARERGYGRTSVELERTIRGSAGSLVQGLFMELYVSGSWKALAQLVRPGDTLRFYASDDNSNGYLRAACIPAGAMDEQYHSSGYPRIYVDELRVNIDRKGRQLVNGMLLTYSICPDNSARAVRAMRPRRD